jgi:hypothetical protein
VHNYSQIKFIHGYVVILPLEGKRGEMRKVKNAHVAVPWWLTPVILATLEAEIRRITVRDQVGQEVPEVLSPK